MSEQQPPSPENPQNPPQRQGGQGGNQNRHGGQHRRRHGGGGHGNRQGGQGGQGGNQGGQQGQHRQGGQGGNQQRQGGQGGQGHPNRQGGQQQGQGGHPNRQQGQGGQGGSQNRHGGQHHGQQQRRHHHPNNHSQGGQHRPHNPDRQPSIQQVPQADVDRVFKDKTAVAPHEWIRLEKGSTDLGMRAIDLLSPIGKGQRGLIVAPPKVGKTTLLKSLAQAVHESDPSIKVYVLLVDERPEEVTDFKRSVPAEVHASSNDKSFDEHYRVSDALFNRAIAEAASGKDVLILLDSLTRLARVHNARATGNRTMTGGLDSRAMEIPRRYFGAARKLEEGGSLTILATILVQTGSKMDDIIFQEFKGTGNMELVLSRPAADQRLFPAIDVRSSGTRKEELLFSPEDLQAVWKLRRALASLPELEATRKVIELLKSHKNNQSLLRSLF